MAAEDQQNPERMTHRARGPRAKTLPVASDHKAPPDHVGGQIPHGES